MVDVQSTSLGLDGMGRYVCSTWAEATTNGGPPFDVIVIGAGMYGAYCAAKLFRLSQRRVLVIEAGPFLAPQHVQNLPNIGFNVPADIPPEQDPGVARDLVWGIPWRGNVTFPGLAYCVGGKSLYWGGWCPRLTADDLQSWPAATAQYLTTNYSELEEETGVTPSTDFITGELYNDLTTAMTNAAAGVANIDQTMGTNGVQEAPLAVQGAAPGSGLFPFDKYSSAPLLIEAVRDDVSASGESDANRRLFVVPRAHVIRLDSAGGVVTAIELAVDGQRFVLTVAASTAVVLAMSAIETTRVALASFPTALIGRNLMAHVRSDFTVRIKREAIGTMPTDVQTAALLVRGAVNNRRFHIQVTASANTGGSDALLFQMIPDLDVLDAQLANDDPTWIAITLRCVGEIVGDQTTAVPNATGSWINLSPYESDEFGAARAYVEFQLSTDDQALWAAMDQTTVDLAQALAGGAANIQYLYDGAWQAQPFPLDRPYPAWHDGLGTTYHEAGTLWMGDDPATSVTDPTGNFHGVANAYACDQSLFPSVGSVNPTLTGLTLARQLAEHLA